MCNEPEFDLPESFIEKVRANEDRERAVLSIPPPPRRPNPKC